MKKSFLMKPESLRPLMWHMASSCPRLLRTLQVLQRQPSVWGTGVSWCCTGGWWRPGATVQHKTHFYLQRNIRNILWTNNFYDDNVHSLHSCLVPALSQTRNRCNKYIRNFYARNRIMAKRAGVYASKRTPTWCCCGIGPPHRAHCDGRFTSRHPA